MQNPTDLLILIGALLTLVFSGIHIAVALGLCSMLGLFMMTGDVHAMIAFSSSTAYEALRDYIFAVIPLFMLMGEFLAKCGAARDLFTLVNRSMHRIRGRLGTATVLANALFAFVTGVSIAAAAAFSKIAYPEMRRHGYERKFALGCIAGSACLGMLIPPSVLMIVWGVLTELSIGKLFIAGILPGLLLTGCFMLWIWISSVMSGTVKREQFETDYAFPQLFSLSQLEVADYDGDGWPDLAASQNDGPLAVDHEEQAIDIAMHVVGAQLAVATGDHRHFAAAFAAGQYVQRTARFAH